MLRVWERAEDKAAPMAPDDIANELEKKCMFVIGFGGERFYALLRDRPTRWVPPEIRPGYLDRWWGGWTLLVDEGVYTKKGRQVRTYQKVDLAGV